MATIASQIGDDAVKALKRAVTKNADDISDTVIKSSRRTAERISNEGLSSFTPKNIRMVNRTERAAYTSVRNENIKINRQKDNLRKIIDSSDDYEKILQAQDNLDMLENVTKRGRKKIPTEKTAKEYRSSDGLNDLETAEEMAKAWGGGSTGGNSSSRKMDNSSAGAAAIDGNNGKLDKFMRQAVPIGIGGGLVFSMFNRNGQMSNSELYGQQKPYGYQ